MMPMMIWNASVRLLRQAFQAVSKASAATPSTPWHAVEPRLITHLSGTPM